MSKTMNTLENEKWKKFTKQKKSWKYDIEWLHRKIKNLRKKIK